MGTAKSQQGPLQVLHLEDNDRDRYLIQEKLREAGFRCEFRNVATGVEFERAVEARAYDLVLSDYSLPAYDGEAALAATRRADASVPFLFVSGTIGEERAVESLRRGATDYVLKGNLGRLEPAVSRALREAEEMRRRRSAETALRAADARFREMADTIRDVFRVSSPDGRRITYVNPACERIWGLSVEELQARPDGWLDAIHPEDRGRAIEALNRLKLGREYRVEYRVVHTDGSVRHVEDRGYPVLNAAGETERSVGVAVDCTERRLLQEKLLEAQRMDAVGQLAGGIAHDFNNLITVIKGHLEIVEGRRGIPPEVSDALRHVMAASDRAARLTNQLLLFSRKQVPRPKTIDLAKSAGALVPMLRPAIGRHIDFPAVVAEGPVLVDADPGMIDQVLTNLAFNARDAMREGGSLTISVARAPRDFRRNGTPEGDAPCGYARLSVGDTGTGIPPDVLPKIFEPFFTTKGVGKGTGLGLASVFGIVKQHGGWIDVETEVGRGSTFHVYLPLSAEREIPPPEAKPAHRPPESQEAILVVEDEAPIRALLQSVLELEGYRVFSAADGIAALSLWNARKGEIKMLITDIVMPGGLTGIDVANRVHEDRPDLPVLYTSGYAPDYARERFRIGEDVNFLEKPYEISHVRRLVRRILDSVPTAT